MKLSTLINSFSLFAIKHGALLCKFVPMLFGGGGGPSSTTSTVTNQTVPTYLKPYVKGMIAGATKQLFQTDKEGNIIGVNPYVPYSSNPADYVAGFSPMQQQAMAQAAQLQVPGQYGMATDFATQAGLGGLESATMAKGYGQAGFQSGQLGQQIGIQAAQRAAQQAAQAEQAAYGYGAKGSSYGDLASQLGLQGLQAQQYGMDVGQQARDYAAQAAATGQNYGSTVTNPYAVQAYMSPYQQNVTDIQKAAALKEFNVAQQMRQANAARAGAYGGSRQAIENAEAQRNLNQQLQAIEAQGQQSAYNQALQNIAQQQQLGLSGLSGAQQGLGTALQGGQLGLSGLAQAISGQNAAMQGQQVGLAGVGQAINAGQLGLQGAQTGLQGTAQGMQGAQVGLQGVQGAQAGYGLANQTAQNLSNIGTQQLAAQQGVIDMQNKLGGQQQGLQQQMINQAIQNYGEQQENPMKSLERYSALLHGYALPQTSQTQYQAAPSGWSQAAGALGTAASLYGMANKKEGGAITVPKRYKTGGLVDLAIVKAMGEA